MKRLVFSILLSSFALVSMAQIFQTNNIPYKFRGVKGDSLMIIPTGVDTPYTTNPKWGESSTGALFLRTSDSSLWGKIGNRYSRITGAGGGGVTTIGTISGTGNANGLSISGSTLTAHPATATTAGMVTTGAQTWAGVKTFNDNINIGLTTVDVPYLQIRDAGGTGLKTGLGYNSGSILQFYNYTSGGYSFNGGGDFNTTPTNNQWAKISSTGVETNGLINVGGVIRSNNTTTDIVRQYYRSSDDVGVAWVNSRHVQFFNYNFPANDPSFTFNFSGGLQTSLTTNEAFRIRYNQAGTVNPFGAGTISPNASAILEGQSTTRGFLPPRLTATQRNAIATPAAGLMVYDTDSSRYMLYGSSWKGLAYTDAGGGGGGVVPHLQAVQAFPLSTARAS